MSCLSYVVPADAHYYFVRHGGSLLQPKSRYTDRENTFSSQQMLWTASQVVKSTDALTDQTAAQIWANLGYFGFLVDGWILLLLRENVQIVDGKEAKSENCK